MEKTEEELLKEAERIKKEADIIIEQLSLKEETVGK